MEILSIAYILFYVYGIYTLFSENIKRLSIFYFSYVTVIIISGKFIYKLSLNYIYNYNNYTAIIYVMFIVDYEDYDYHYYHNKYTPTTFIVCLISYLLICLGIIVIHIIFI